MRILKRFRLGSKLLKVSRQKKTHRQEGRECRGYYDEEEGRIWVCPVTRGELETFFHEFFHASCDDSGVRQVDGWSNDIEEILCEKFSRYVVEYITQVNADDSRRRRRKPQSSK